jgi:hypothetical protein
MRPQDLEPDVEALLVRLLPDLPQRWEGASAQEIEQMEALAGRPLPIFYRWFLQRMGCSTGPLLYAGLDLSVGKILSCYAEGLVAPNPRFFLIGYETDPVGPLHLFYDFSYPARDDARVITRLFAGGPAYVQFETFREMLVWGEFVASRIEELPQHCSGCFKVKGVDALDTLQRLLQEQGFVAPVPTGACCALYDRADAAMAVSSTPSDPPSPYFFFEFGGPNSSVLRRVLGVIATRSTLDCEVMEWNPPLPGRPGKDVSR